MAKKVCVVVGAGPGIGLAVARKFAREGFEIALLARRTEALETYVAELRRVGGVAHPFPVDVADMGRLADVFEHINTQVGAPQVLVYNAAIVRQGQPSELNVADLVAQFQINVAAGLTCAQQVIPNMKTQNNGTILFTGGGLALNPHPLYSSLAASKAALRNLCYSLSTELEPFGIHVATVTIAGYVQPDTFFDPNLIAERYWQLHSQKPGQWQTEIVYKKAE